MNLVAYLNERFQLTYNVASYASLYPALGSAVWRFQIRPSALSPVVNVDFKTGGSSQNPTALISYSASTTSVIIQCPSTGFAGVTPGVYLWDFGFVPPSGDFERVDGGTIQLAAGVTASGVTGSPAAPTGGADTVTGGANQILTPAPLTLTAAIGAAAAASIASGIEGNITLAATSAGNAAASATAAAASADSAEAAAAAAEGAGTSGSAAATAATEAAGSATAAAGSAASATAAATAAAASAMNAAASATAAEAAGIAGTAAATSATAAAASATAAAGSATTATTQASNASTSATAAAASATAASGAGASATAAAGSATAAAGSATTATTQAGNASTSATAAAASATAAAASVASISGGAVTSVVGLTGVITITQLNTALTALASKTITASTIDSSAIGATTASTGAFTTLSATGAVTLPGGSITNAMLAGSITAANLVGTDITSVGTLVGGATGAGFTVNLGTSTISGTLPASAHPALTGDITSTAGALATTLATVNTNVGSFGSSSSIPTFTVNGKGLITAAGSVTITSVGTLVGGATGAGFTVNLGTSTISGTLPASAHPALTGDVTNTAGSLATTVGKIGGMSVTLAGSLTTSGAYGLTLTTTGATSVTLPTSGTLAALSGTNTWTGTQTPNGTSSALGVVLLDAAETVNVVGSAPASTTNFYVQSGAVQYYTSNAANNWTLNIAFSSGTTLNTAMAIGQSVTIALVTKQGTTAYYNSAVTVDGSAVTPYWLGGTAPTAGNASGVDVYSYTVIKTASATYTVLASQTKF